MDGQFYTLVEAHLSMPVAKLKCSPIPVLGIVEFVFFSLFPLVCNIQDETHRASVSEQRRNFEKTGKLWALWHRSAVRIVD